VNRERAIRTRALRDVLRGDGQDYLVRSRVRWYARTFGLDPRVVEAEVPLDDVLQHWWESRYEEMLQGSKEDLQALEQERETLAMTAEELAAVQKIEDERDAQYERELDRDRRDRKPGPTPPPPPVPSPIPDELTLRPSAKLPEDVDISFPDAWEDQDALGGGMLDTPQS
jgi:hypothetical protein